MNGNKGAALCTEKEKPHSIVAQLCVFLLLQEKYLFDRKSRLFPVFTSFNNHLTTIKKYKECHLNIMTMLWNMPLAASRCMSEHSSLSLTGHCPQVDNCTRITKLWNTLVTSSATLHKCQMCNTIYPVTEHCSSVNNVLFVYGYIQCIQVTLLTCLYRGDYLP